MRQEKKSVQSSARLPVCGKPLTVLTVAVIMLTALFSSGCVSHRKSVTTASQEQLSETIRTDSVVRLALDSVSEFVEVRTEPLLVPKSEVSLTIATDSLRRLPGGASYSERSGQASVKVSRRAATATEPEYIYVYATCDSLQLQCERYERTIRSLHRDYGELQHRMENEIRKVKEKPPAGIGTALEWYCIGLVSGVLIILIVKLAATWLQHRKQEERT